MNESPSRHTRLKVVSGYLLLFAVTISAIVSIYHQLERLAEGEDSVGDTNRKLYLIGQTMASLYEAETWGNSFLMTGDTLSLNRYVAVTRRATAGMDSLRTVADNPVQRGRIDTIRLLMGDKSGNLQELLKIKQSQASEAYFNRAIDRIRREGGRVARTPQVRERVITATDSVYVATMKKRKRFLGLFSTVVPDSVLRVVTTQHIVYDTVNPVNSWNTTDSVVNILRYTWNDFQSEKEALNRQISRREYLIINRSVQLTNQLKQVMRTYEKEEIARSIRRLEERSQAVTSSTRVMAAISAVAVLLVVLFCTLVLRDIERNRRYRIQVEEANARSARLLKSREQMMLTVTHDIKSPLGSVMGYIELLLDHVSDSRQRYFLENMKSSSDHIQKLVTNLLDLSKLESGKMLVEEVAFVPARLFGEIADTFVPLAQEKGIEIRRQFCEGLNVACFGDALRVRQIITNLLSNAVKYTDKGVVEFTAATDGRGRMNLQVVDTGRGMTPDEQKVIFDEFTRLSSSADVEGSGLGLTITLKLIRLLQGELKVESEPGKGSRFTVTLPWRAADGEEKMASGSASDRVEPVTSKQKGALRALLVDDDAVQLDMTGQLLRRHGVEAVTTTCPAEVGDRLRREHFDILFSDIQMPGMTGLELVRHIRAAGLSLPVVALSGDSERTESDFKAAGFDAYLAKPFTSAQLLEVVRRICPETPVARESAEVPESHRACVRGEGYNLRHLESFTDGDPQALREVLHSFIRDTEANVSLLESYKANNDGENIQRLAHKMGSMFRQIEANEIAQLLRTLETTTYQPPLSNPLVQDVIAKSQALMEEVRIRVGL